MGINAISLDNACAQHARETSALHTASPIVATVAQFSPTRSPGDMDPDNGALAMASHAGDLWDPSSSGRPQGSHLPVASSRLQPLPSTS